MPDERDTLHQPPEPLDSQSRDYWRLLMQQEEGFPVTVPDMPEPVDLPDDGPGDDRTDGALKNRYDDVEGMRALDWLSESAAAGLPSQRPEEERPQPSMGVPSSGGEREAGIDGPVRFIGDLWRGTVEAPRQIIGGVRDAAQSTLDLLDEFSDAANAAVPLSKMSPDQTSFGTLPEVGDPQTATGGMVRGVSRFLAGFATGSKLLGGIKAATPAAKLAVAMGAGAIADFISFGGHEERLSDLVQEFPQLANPVSEYLSADPEDTEVEGRFKNAIEGLGLGAATSAFARGLRAIRAQRNAMAKNSRIRARRDARAARAEPATDDFPIAGARDMLDLGSPDLPASGRIKDIRADAAGDLAKADIPAEDMAKSLTDRGLTPLGDGDYYVNWARIEGPDDIKQVIQDTSTAFKGDLDKAKRGVRSNVDTLEAAQEVDAWEALTARRSGEPMNAEQSVAARQLWVAAADRLKTAAQTAVTEPSPENLYAFRRMAALFHGVQKEVLAARAETARALQSWRIPVGGEMENMTAIQNALNNHGGMNATQEYALKVLSTHNRGIGSLSEFIDKSVYERSRDAVTEYWINSILSGPKTHLVNMMSNTSVIGLRLAETATAARLGKVLGGDDVVEIGEAMATWHGMRTSFTDALRNSGHAFRTGETGFGMNKVEGPRVRSISSTAWNLRSDSMQGRAVDALGAVVTTPGRALGAEDEFFKTIGYRGSLHQQAYRMAQQELSSGKITFAEVKDRMADIIANPPESIHLEAAASAAYQTFTSEPGKFVKALLKIRHDWPMAKYVVPFVNTPANIFKFTAERTPLAPLTAKYKAAIAKGGAEADLAQTKMALGTMITLLAVDMGLNGQTTGSGPASYTEMANLRRTGWQPYSIKAGDKYIAYNRMDPIGTLFGFGGDIGEYLANADAMDDLDEGEMEEVIYSTIFSVMENVTSKTYLRGLTDTIEAINSPTRYAEYYIRRLAGGFVPNIVREVSSFHDPTVRYTTGLLEEMKSRLPGYREDLPPRRDLWGRPISYQSGIGPLYDALSPLYGSTYEPQPIDDEMRRDGWFAGMPTKGFQISGQRISLRNRMDIYSRYVELQGSVKPSDMGESGAGLIEDYGDAPLLDTLNAIVENRHPLSAEYRQEPYAEDRESFLRKIVSAYRRAAKGVIFEEHPELQDTAQERIMRARALETE